MFVRMMMRMFVGMGVKVFVVALHKLFSLLIVYSSQYKGKKRTQNRQAFATKKP